MIYKNRREEYKKTFELLSIALGGNSTKFCPNIIFCYLVCTLFVFFTFPSLSQKLLMEPVIGNAVIAPKLRLVTEKKLEQRQ